MRCHVLLTQYPKSIYPDPVNTDIEVWREGTTYKKALVTSGPWELARYSVARDGLNQLQKTIPQRDQVNERCKKSDAPETSSNG